MAGHSRKIVEERSFTTSRDAIVSARRWDEFFWALDWVLSRDSGGFDQVDAIPLWVVICEASPRLGMPRLRLYYTFDVDAVYLRWIELG